MKFSFIKVFPSSDEKATAGVSSNGQCKATGSGVLISDNIIITNYHVVEDAEKVEAIININGIPETFSARVLCTDKTNDLAIVCVKDNKFKSVENAPFRILPNTIDVGTSVFAMGFPLTTFLGDEVKITDGIISSKSGYEGDIVTYQISVPIQPGNSGGPLFDKNGNLVGITSAGIDKSIAENVGYAIKTPYVLNIIDSAPINISLPKGNDLMGVELPELIKALKPYVVYIKTY
ncbi:MAG: trypsin-like peptidase domain-containing protein [Bacteroides sp.]|nr:trypsin-like peptidase domain-containing protein [Bacteroides sp.]